MSDRFHVGTFVWGLILTIGGAALAAVGFGWWDLAVLDLTYMGPLLMILVGTVLLIGALVRGTRHHDDVGQSS